MFHQASSLYDCAHGKQSLYTLAFWDIPHSAFNERTCASIIMFHYRYFKPVLKTKLQVSQHEGAVIIISPSWIFQTSLLLVSSTLLLSALRFFLFFMPDHSALSTAVSPADVEPRPTSTCVSTGTGGRRHDWVCDHKVNLLYLPVPSDRCYFTPGWAQRRRSLNGQLYIHTDEMSWVCYLRASAWTASCDFFRACWEI